MHCHEVGESLLQQYAHYRKFTKEEAAIVEGYNEANCPASTTARIVSKNRIFFAISKQVSNLKQVSKYFNPNDQLTLL